jgi:hypothetical protein
VSKSRFFHALVFRQSFFIHEGHDGHKEFSVDILVNKRRFFHDMPLALVPFRGFVLTQTLFRRRIVSDRLAQFQGNFGGIEKY